MAEGKVFGVLAEFESVDSIMDAARKVRDEGYTRWDVYTPFPVHGMNEAMGMRDTRLPWIVLGGGIAGALGGLLMQWWMNAIDYPLIIAGKPLFSLPANIPVTFETTVLLAAFAAVGGMLMMSDLPKFFHPTARSKRFKRVTDDRFFICIESRDPKFDRDGTSRLVESLGASAVEWLED